MSHSLQIFIQAKFLVLFSRFETKKQFWPEGKKIPSPGKVWQDSLMVNGGPEKSVISSLYKICFLCHFEELRLRSNFDSREKIHSHGEVWAPQDGDLEAP